MRLASALVTLVAAAVVAVPASASQLVDRNAHGVTLAVDSGGHALISYVAAGRRRHVLAWGAVDARQPTESVPQVKLRLDYSGGWGTFRRQLWRTFVNRCTPYTGPPLAFQVATCTAPDGTYWALQAWQVPLPDLGFAPWTPQQRALELHVSHWSGPVAQLEAHTDWVYGGRYQEVFGRVTYRGNPVYGFHTTRYGAPLEGYGRLVYLDTLDSVYGNGWRRENSFVTHNPTGVFCYGFYRFDPSSGGYVHPPTWSDHALRGPGTGSAYRLTVEGPGVTPDVSTTIPGLHPYDPANASDATYEQQQNTLRRSLAANDRLCQHD